MSEISKLISNYVTEERKLSLTTIESCSRLGDTPSCEENEAFMMRDWFVGVRFNLWDAYSSDSGRIPFRQWNYHEKRLTGQIHIMD